MSNELEAQIISLVLQRRKQTVRTEMMGVKSQNIHCAACVNPQPLTSVPRHGSLVVEIHIRPLSRVATWPLPLRSGSL